MNTINTSQPKDQAVDSGQAGAPTSINEIRANAQALLALQSLVKSPAGKSGSSTGSSTASPFVVKLSAKSDTDVDSADANLDAIAQLIGAALPTQTQTVPTTAAATLPSGSDTASSPTLSAAVLAQLASLSPTSIGTPTNLAAVPGAVTPPSAEVLAQFTVLSQPAAPPQSTPIPVSVPQVPLESTAAVETAPSVLPTVALASVEIPNTAIPGTAVPTPASPVSVTVSASTVVVENPTAQADVQPQADVAPVQVKPQSSNADTSSNTGTPSENSQAPVGLGAAILQSMSQQSQALNQLSSTASSSTTDRIGQIESLMTQMADRVLVADPLHSSTPEVRVKLSDSIMPGTEVTVTRVDGGGLSVSFTTTTAEWASVLNQLAPQLAQRLNDRIQMPEPVLVSVQTSGGAPGDGRSRERHTPWDQANKNQ